MSAVILPFDRNTTTKPSTAPKPKGTKSRKASTKAKPITGQERAALDRLMATTHPTGHILREIRKEFPEGSPEAACIEMAEEVLRRLFFMAHDRLNPKPEPK
jgi:hypothetical protein